MMNIMTNPLVAFMAEHQKILTTFTVFVTCLTLLDIWKALRGEKNWESVIGAAAVNFSGLAAGMAVMSIANLYQWIDGVPQWMLACAAGAVANMVFVMIAGKVSQLLSRKGEKSAMPDFGRQG